MPHVNKRSFATRAVAVAATAAAALGVVALATPGADAATSTLFTITKVSVHRLPALTSNQVITLTGTGFDEDLISGVTINGCTTDSDLRRAEPDHPAAEDRRRLRDLEHRRHHHHRHLDQHPGHGPQHRPAAPSRWPSWPPRPSLTMDATHNAATTDATAGVAFANQVVTVSTKGGGTIRVTAGATPFVNSTTYPLSATLGGVALTKVTMPTNGAYFTGVVGAHAADAAPVLRVTSNGVTKSFGYGASGASAVAGTHPLQYAGVGVSVSPTSGPVGGGTVLTITGTGFTASTTATVDGTACPKGSNVTTATVFKCTVPATDRRGRRGRADHHRLGDLGHRGGQHLHLPGRVTRRG